MSLWYCWKRMYNICCKLWDVTVTPNWCSPNVWTNNRNLPRMDVRPPQTNMNPPQENASSMFSFYHKGYFRFHVSSWWCRKTMGCMWLAARVCSNNLPQAPHKLHLREKQKHHVGQIFSLPSDVVEFPCFRLQLFLMKSKTSSETQRHHTCGYTLHVEQLLGDVPSRSTRWAPYNL